MSNSANLWAGASQAPCSVGFSRWEYWSRLIHPPSWDLLNQGIESTSLKSPESENESSSVLCDSYSPGQNTGVGSLSLLQGIFPIQGLNPALPHCRPILYQLSHKGSSRVLKWVGLSILQGIFPNQESNWGLLPCRWILYQLSYQGSKTKISCIASKFFTTSATWKPVKNRWYFLLIHGRWLCFIAKKCIEYITEIRTKKTFFGLGASGSFFNPKPSTKCHKSH